MESKEDRIKKHMKKRMERIKQSDVMELMIVNGSRESEREGVFFTVSKAGLYPVYLETLEKIIGEKREEYDMF